MVAPAGKAVELQGEAEEEARSRGGASEWERGDAPPASLSILSGLLTSAPARPREQSASHRSAVLAGLGDLCRRSSTARVESAEVWGGRGVWRPPAVATHVL